MRKRFIAAGLIFFVLASLQGCEILGKSKSEGISKQIRETYQKSKACKMIVSVSADSNGKIFKYKLSYTHSSADGSGVLEIIEPAEVSGIRVKILKNGSVIEYQSVSLETPLPKKNGFTPVDVLPVMISDWVNSIPSEVASEKLNDVECTSLMYEMKQGEEVLRKKVWFENKTLKPVKIELFEQGKRIMECEVLQFEIV